MRRDFGSALFDLIDAKMHARNILALYMATAIAIDKWEPRFRVTKARVPNATAGGRIELEIYGTYFPRGHLGDYSVAEDASVRVAIEAAT